MATLEPLTEKKHHPIAISLIEHSEVYGDRTGVWEWFYVSPRAIPGTFPLRLAREGIRRGQKEGLKSLVSYVSVEDRLLQLQWSGYAAGYAARFFRSSQ